MFSVTKTELKIFPLCTRKVCPTKSGVMVERRDHVLIGFFVPASACLSIFSSTCKSTKGPFLRDLPIYYFAFLRETMNRLLGLCFRRVLNPLANWPHGL